MYILLGLLFGFILVVILVLVFGLGIAWIMFTNFVANAYGEIAGLVAFLVGFYLILGFLWGSIMQIGINRKKIRDRQTTQ